MKKIDEVYATLESEGLQLAAGTHLEEAGDEGIRLCNDDALDAESYVMYVADSASDMLDYLRRENLTEIE